MGEGPGEAHSPQQGAAVQPPTNRLREERSRSSGRGGTVVLLPEMALNGVAQPSHPSQCGGDHNDPGALLVRASFLRPRAEQLPTL